jgi:hypothetical protein
MVSTSVLNVYSLAGGLLFHPIDNGFVGKLKGPVQSIREQFAA